MKTKIGNVGWNILRILSSLIALGSIIAIVRDVYAIKASGIPENSFAIGLIVGHIVGLIIGIGLFTLSENKIKDIKQRTKVTPGISRAR